MLKKQNNKWILALDEDILKSWSNLNPAERYFTLLEAWLLRGKFEILGEPKIEGQFSNCVHFLQHIPQNGLKVSGKKKEERIIQYVIGTYNLALLELFGFLEIEDGQPEKGKGWKILKVNKVPFGQAFFNLLLTVYTLDEYNFLFSRPSKNEIKPSWGEWQETFQPFFPEWRNNLVVPEILFRDGLYIFKVSLWQTIWRRIAIPARQNLHTFSCAILESFKFGSDHLYFFIYEDRFGHIVKINHPYMEDEPILATEFLIGDLPIPIGDDMFFHFDFGDNWQFCVTLENIEPMDPRIRDPKILEKHGKAPEQYRR